MRSGPSRVLGSLWKKIAFLRVSSGLGRVTFGVGALLKRSARLVVLVVGGEMFWWGVSMVIRPCVLRKVWLVWVRVAPRSSPFWLRVRPVLARVDPVNFVEHTVWVWLGRPRVLLTRKS